MPTPAEQIQQQQQQTNVFISKQNLIFNIIVIIVCIVSLICLNIFAFNPNYKETKFVLVASIISNILISGYVLTLIVSSYRFDLPCIKSKGDKCYKPVSKNTRYR